MEQHRTDPRNNSRNPQTSTTQVGNTLSSQSTHNLQLPKQPKPKTHITQSSVYLDHGTKQNIRDRPSVLPKQDHKKKQVEKRDPKEGELVKYMSDLPCYLQRVEKGENLQEKALNFGVLDWGRLEKWKHDQKQMPRNSIYPSSNNRTPSPFSTTESQAQSTKSDNGYQSRQTQRKHSPSLHCERIQSSKESQSVKSCRENATSFQDLNRVPANSSVLQKNLPTANLSLGTPKGKEKYADPDIVIELGTSSSKSKRDEVPLCPKDKTRTRGFESPKRTEQYREFRLPDEMCDGRQKTIVLLLPRDSIEKSTSQQFESKSIGDGRPKEANRKSFSDNFRIDKEVHFSELYSDIPHSCPLPRRSESSEELVRDSNNSNDRRRAKTPVCVPHPLRCSDETATVPARDKHVKENSSSTEPSVHQCPNVAEAAAVKGRDPSTIHPAVGLGQMSRSHSSKEVSSFPQLHSTSVSAKSGPVGLDASCVNNSDKEKISAKNRSRSSPGRSSPLRRLLDPLLKSKSVGHQKSVQDESKPKQKPGRASSPQFDSSKDNPVKKKLNVSGVQTTKASDPCQDEKHDVKTVQALLKVTVKDGLPSFRFVVDDNSSILTATMKKINSFEKYDCSWIYTFYSFHKSKKKNGGWMNQGIMGKSHDYVPKVAAEMKVSSSKCPHSSNGQFMVREFVLFGVEQVADRDLKPNNELAAIIVKVPKENTGKLISDGGRSEEILSSECLRDERCCCYLEENLQRETLVVSPSISSTIVILPHGVHGLSATGIPSPLMDRWRSGGSCDCEGWDEGCNLRTLATIDQSCKASNSSIGLLSPVQFDLFDQGGMSQEKRAVFSLGTFTEGIFSVDFDVSISSLQAFSICAAVLHGRKLAELSEVSNLLEDQISQEFISTKTYATKVPTEILEGEAPTYVPFPPHSPVGRV